MTKRCFLKYALSCVVAVVSAMAAWGAARFAFFDTGAKKEREVSRGVLSKLEPDVPLHDPEAGVWLVKGQDGDQLIAFDDRCPHLGCRQNWNPDLRLFECPCHGSRFDSQGNVTRGPASRSMPRLYLSDAENNRLTLQEKLPGS